MLKRDFLNSSLLRIREHVLVKFLCLSLCLSFSACSSLSSDLHANLVAKQDVSITTQGEQEKRLKAGDKIQINPEKPLLVESPGYISTLVIPIKPESANWDLRLKKVEEWSGAEYENQVNKLLNNVTASIIEVQRLLSVRKAKEAIEKTESLQRRYPGISYLNFLRVSCLLVLGDVPRAKAALEQGLKDFPTDPAGLALKKQLSGSQNKREGKTSSEDAS